MSWANVQSNSATMSGAGTSLAATFSSPVTPGNFLLVRVSGFTTALPPGLSVSDGANSYTVDSNPRFGGSYGVFVGIAHAIATTGGTLTVTATVSTGSTVGYLSLSIAEYSMTSGSILSIDSGPASGSGTGTALSTSNLTLTSTDACFAAATCGVQSISFVAGGSWSILYQNAGVPGAYEALCALDLLNTSTTPVAGAVTANGNTGTGNTWIMAAIAFQAVGGSVGVGFATTIVCDRSGSRRRLWSE